MLRMECYTSVKEIPCAIWERFVSHGSVGLEIAHLHAIEDSHINDIHPYYIIGYREEEPVGIAYCFSIQMDLSGMSTVYPPDILASMKVWKPDFMKIRIVEVGHIASLGATIEVLQVYVTDFLKLFSDTIDKIARIENADLCLIRDIAPTRYCDFRLFGEYGYQAVMGFPIARIPLRWNTFDGYLASLKSKKRNNVLQKRAKLRVPEITVEIIDDYAQYAECLSELWKNVALRNNGYQHERLTPDYFAAMSRHLHGRSHVVAIKQHGKIVAYGLNLIGDEEYLGVAEGLDYDVRDIYDLYANNIFEGIRVACELGKKTFNAGITAYGFKTSFGAEIDSCIYFVKAVKESGYSLIFADFIRKLINQPENHHRAFRDIDTLKRIQPKDIEAMLHSSDDPLDPQVLQNATIVAP